MTQGPPAESPSATQRVGRWAAAPTPDPTPADTPAPAAGRSVGRFRVERELGRGGMGVVFLARQDGLNRPVALKLVAGADPAARRRFLLEAEAVASVRHPHVAEVFASGDAAGQPFLAMELLPGGSLADKLRAGRLAAAEAVGLVAKLAAGVQAAHDAGIVHRDLKPGNVLFDAAGSPKVTDFGLAKRSTGGQTATHAVLGTPAYMAPEQAGGRAKFVGPAADVYALGVILFECLTGTRPFAGDDSVSLLLRVATEDAPDVRAVCPDVSRDLAAVVRRCLQKEPHDRYPTAAALAADLHAVAAGERPAAAGRSALGGLRRALDRSLNAGEFAGYAGLFLWMVPVMLAADGTVGLALLGMVPEGAAPAAQFARVGLVVGLVWRVRRGRLPRTPAERQLWGLWGGYLLTCFVTALSHRLVYGWAVPDEARLYQPLALLSGLAFFALGATFWGWFYAIGLVFLGLALAMAADLRLAPFGFGLVWAGVLVVCWRFLRRKAAEAAA